MRIGICDWGIGGLGFYRLLRADRPDVDVVYLGDQGFTPYGRVSTKELTGRLNWVLHGFQNKGVSQVVVACNAASTVLPFITAPGVVATGVIDAALDRLRRENTSVGVIGGRRTILSGSYRRPLSTMGIRVSQRVAQPLSRLIEDGQALQPETTELLHSILRPIRDARRIVLACTHYVVLTDAVQQYMPEAEIIDPATEVWTRMRGILPTRSDSTGTSQFYTTGDPSAMERQALAAFQVAAKVTSWS